MIIDCHGHVSAPQQLWAYRSLLLAQHGWDGPSPVRCTDDEIRYALEVPEISAYGHLPLLNLNGIDLQLVSPRPNQLMHSEHPAKIIRWFSEAAHDLIARQVELFPDRFAGTVNVPMAAGQPVTFGIPELERCVHELGFVGAVINPDPYENTGPQAPPLSDRYWYPLYEKLCELDVPAHVHATTSRSDRVGYSAYMLLEETTAIMGLIDSSVLDDFPDLKLIIPHGGGAIPYQIGRFDATSIRKGEVRFRDRLRKLYFDTVLYSKASLELLIRTVGVSQTVFGAECPGIGTAVDPETGLLMDDLGAVIRSIDFLSDADRDAILAGNARRIYKLPAATAGDLPAPAEVTAAT